MKFLFRLAALLMAGLVAVVITSTTAEADHEEYRYKWPYNPGVADGTTGFPFHAHHASADAWDFDIGLNNTGDDIRSSAEGIVITLDAAYNPNSCVATDGGGFGNHVKVLVDMPAPQLDITMTYAHLTSVNVSLGQRILQGDLIGIEGKTGNTDGSEQPNSCGTHLHWQFNPGRPTFVDGVNVSAPFPDTPPGGPSTNSWVDAPDAPAQAIRQVFVDFGTFIGSSWGVFGWTADLDPPHQGCVTIPRCQIFIHYTPDPDQGRWGSIIDFKKHPVNFTYWTLPVSHDADAIMAGRWDVNNAYWVQLPFYLSWLLGTAGQPLVATGTDIGLPLMEQLDSSVNATRCPPSQGCTGYQRFSHGFIWSDSGAGVYPAVFCPDVAGSPFGTPWPDDIVDLPNDILGTLQAFGMNDTGQPFEPWDNARFDVNGDGVIDLPNDILGVIQHFNMTCHP